MDKIPTASEYLDEHSCGVWEDTLSGEGMADCVAPSTLISFAKMHVEAALKEAAEKAKLKGEAVRFESEKYTGGMDLTVVDKESILNAYPVENIK